MNKISISVPTRGNITSYDIARAIENRREQLENRSIQYPELQSTTVPMTVNRVTSHSFFKKFLP